jgi:uncharacterized protein
MLSKTQFLDAVQFAQDGSHFTDSIFHGNDHWRAVASQGLTLSAVNKMPQVAFHVAAIFGLFHDSRRHNDDYDPEHGTRGAQALSESPIADALPASMLETLMTSCILHDGGQVTRNPMMGLGWDADRSVLTRVGIEPDISFFSVVREPDFIDFIASGLVVTSNPPSWEQIWEMAFTR